MKKIFLSFVFLFLLPSIFYAASEPGGGDVSEYVEREPIPGHITTPDYIMREQQQNSFSSVDIRILQAKPKFLTFNTAIGTGGQNELEIGLRFTCYFRETAEKFNVGLIFGTNYMSAWVGQDRDDPNTPKKRHYLSFSSLAAVYIHGFHLAAGLDYNIKFKGPDSDPLIANMILYKKSYFAVDIEIGYLLMPKNNRFTVLLAGVVKGQLGGGAYEYQSAYHQDVKVLMWLFRVQIGLFLF